MGYMQAYPYLGVEQRRAEEADESFWEGEEDEWDDVDDDDARELEQNEE
jgi:hypothetical protein